MNDDIENLDRLADELEGLRVDTPAPGLSRLEPWLRMVADRGASDLLLVAGEPPSLRVDGRIARTDVAPLDGVDIEETVLPALPPHARRAISRGAASRTRRACTGIGRFRINLHHERGRAAAAVRLLPDEGAAIREPRSAADSEVLARCRAASCSSAGRPAPARRRRSRRSSTRSIGARRGTSSRSRIRSNTSTRTTRASSSRWRSAWTRRTFRRRCAPRCARRRTSSSSARCAIRRRCGLRSAAAETGHLVFSTLHTTRRGVDASRASPIRFRPSGRTRFARSWRWRSRRCSRRRCCRGSAAGSCRPRNC